MKISQLVFVFTVTLICGMQLNGVCKKCECLDADGYSTGKSETVCGATKDALHPQCKSFCASDNFAVYG